MADKKKASLVELAKSHVGKRSSGKPASEDFNQKLDLAFALLRGEVTGSQCAHALSCRQSGAHTMLAYALVSAAKKGIVTITDNRKSNQEATA